MKHRKKTIRLSFLSVFLSFSVFASQTAEKGNDISKYIDNLLIPFIIAVFGYLLKLLYEAYIDRSKRKHSLLEEKLKNFYWPILTRLEQNEAIWTLILKKRDDLNELEKKIGAYVEAHIVLKNHREIMQIIIDYRYHAKFDEKLSLVLKNYFKHVAIYEGILESKENTFPGLMGAPYPPDFDPLIKKRTERLQRQLDKN